ncbi:MAG: hypothetical protein ABFD79_06225 [Phycisphaerales bacterium]
MKTKACKFWVYVISDGKSDGLLIKKQDSPDAAQECEYFHFAGGLSPTFEILSECKGCYEQLSGKTEERRFVNGLIDYIQSTGGTKKNQTISEKVTDGQPFPKVINHFFERVKSPLLDFFVSADIFRRAVLRKVRNKNEYIGMAEEFGVLSPHNLTVNDLKYIRPIEKVLKVQEEKKAQWFRKSGPLAIDFDNNFIYPRGIILNDLKHKILSNFGLILEGDIATGKTVLVRYLGYTLRKDMPVYYFDCSEKRDFDYEILVAQINNLQNGVFILENIHLETQKFQLFFSRLQPDKTKHILFTTRPSLPETHIRRFEAIDVLGRVGLNPFDDVDPIINHFAQYHSNVSWSEKIYEAIKNVSRNNFWLLSYALMGYVKFQGKGKPSEWLKSEVEADLKDLANIDAKVPNVVVALSALYQNEVLTSAKYLLATLNFDETVLRKLVIAGEITKQMIDGDTFYGLPHSALAMAYWEHGTEYRNLLKYSDYEDIVYNYSISNVSNGLLASLKTDKETCIKLFHRLIARGKIFKVIENEKYKNSNDSIKYIDTINALHNTGHLNILSLKLADFFVKRKCYIALASLFMVTQSDSYTNAMKCWQNMRRADKYSLVNAFFDDIYPSPIISLIKLFTNKNDMIKVEIIDLIDVNKLAMLADQCPDLSMVFRIIAYLGEFDEHLCKNICDHMDISILEDKINKLEDVIFKLSFLLWFCDIKSTAGKRLIHMIDSIIPTYVEMVMNWNPYIDPCVQDIYFNDLLFRVKPAVAQELYTYICNHIGLENYIKQINIHYGAEYRGQNKYLMDAKASFGSRVSYYFSKVDPEDKQGWKQYFYNIE